MPRGKDDSMELWEMTVVEFCGSERGAGAEGGGSSTLGVSHVLVSPAKQKTTLKEVYKTGVPTFLLFLLHKCL